MKLPKNLKCIIAVFKNTLLTFIALSVSYYCQAQIFVSGVVTQEPGFGLQGVTVSISGTNQSVFTDKDGAYSISAPGAGSILEFSHFGYDNQDIIIGDHSTINIIMSEESDFVDVGYGTQGKKEVSSSLSVVSTHYFNESTSISFDQALQGKIPGVYITTSGTPGSSSSMYIRGVGSVINSEPLVIIDGVSGSDLSSVNPKDIEAVSILKDASATSIYGARGANGVIVVNTKQGIKGDQPIVSYNSYIGKSYMSNNGFDLLNGWELMEFYAQGMINLQNTKGIEPGVNPQFGGLTNVEYDYTNTVGFDDYGNPLYYINSGELTMPYATNPAGYSEEQIIDMYGSIEAWEESYVSNGTSAWTRSAYNQILYDLGVNESTATESQLSKAKAGTNWYDLIVRDAIIQDHHLSIVGGNDKGGYSMGLGYTSHEGTILSSFYDRYTLSLNTTFNPRSFISIGQNSSIAFTEFQGDRGLQEEGSAINLTYAIKSFVPVYTVDGEFAGSKSNDGGRSSSAFATVSRQKEDWDRGIRMQNSVFAEITPIPELSIRSQISTNFNGDWSRIFSERTNMDANFGTSKNSLFESAGWEFKWQWTNTATFSKKLYNNNLTFVIGTEAIDQGYGRKISGLRYDYIFPDDQNTWILSNGSSADASNSGTMASHSSMMGIFGRANYSYKGKYLASFAVRRDGSSKFSPKNRWGTFPSLSLGWRISDESFMANTSGWLNDLKIRGGWGTSGNANIGAYNWRYQYATGNPYIYSISGSDVSVATGYGISYIGNTDAKWESTEMFNTGLDASAFNNRLSMSIDFFIKKTSNMLLSENWITIPGTATNPTVNLGDMSNTGVEINLGWKENIGKFSYSLNGNLSHYRNKVISLGSSDQFSSTRINNITITTPEKPLGMYYGFNILGIYNSVEDVFEYTTNGTTVLPSGAVSLDELVPEEFIGRFKIEDVNTDGIIDNSDLTIIGNPHPDFTGGLNISAGYGNWDVSSFLYFSVGNDLYKMYMFYTHYGFMGSNYSKDRRDNSWSPSNPSGIYPMWTGYSTEANETTSTSNSLYVEDGSYLRMQNLSIGYNLPNSVLNKLGASQFRIYGQISNLFTFTNYSGLDPEINGSSRSMGVDYGAYGIPRQLIFGVNVIF